GRIAGRPLARTYVLDRAWFSRWFLGRRIWIFLALVFQSHVFVMMNIGHFQTGMISACIPFFTGHEVAAVLRMLGRGLARLGVPWIPRDVVEGKPPLPAEDPAAPHHHRDAAELPVWSMVVTLGIVVLGVVVRAVWAPSWWWGWIWVAALVFVVVVGVHRWRLDGKTSLSIDDPH